VRITRMAIWQIALLVLAAAWGVQSLGVWLQVQHYQRTFGAVRAQWSDGRLGVGAAPGRVGKGVIALVVVSPDGCVRKLHAMQGRSVFAKFKDRPEFEGIAVEDLKARANAAGFDRGFGTAILKAIEQIEKIETPRGTSDGAGVVMAV
jgi:glucitol operon activator protein